VEVAVAAAVGVVTLLLLLVAVVVVVVVVAVVVVLVVGGSSLSILLREIRKWSRDCVIFLRNSLAGQVAAEQAGKLDPALASYVWLINKSEVHFGTQGIFFIIHGLEYTDTART
jgi:hypothetical protein